jgi:hypothetical protein
MAKSGRSGRGGRSSGPTKQQRLSRRATFGVAVIAALLTTGAWWGLTKTRGQAAPTNAGTAPATSTGNGPARDASTPNQLLGRWQRSDGGYVLEFRAVAPEGTLDAGYFNPAPIKVSVARVTSVAGVIGANVELRDVNYPGSTYTLTYDAANDLLVGKYFQALEQQTFDVVFARQR